MQLLEYVSPDTHSLQFLKKESKYLHEVFLSIKKKKAVWNEDMMPNLIFMHLLCISHSINQ